MMPDFIKNFFEKCRTDKLKKRRLAPAVKEKRKLFAALKTMNAIGVFASKN
jgi:hypothetical protein